MIVVARREKTVVLTGWRAWQAWAVVSITAWSMLAFVAFVLIGLTMTIAAALLLIGPAILVALGVQALLWRRRS